MQTAKMKKISTTVFISLMIISGCTRTEITSENENQGEKAESFSLLQRVPADRPATLVNDDKVMLKKEYLAEEGMSKNMQLAAPPAIPLHTRAATAGLSGEPGREKSQFPPLYSSQMESYNNRTENSFISAANDPLSTFSIDVDTASYSNIRRFIQSGHLPPVGAVRIEEMINYFSYNHPEPDSEPFSIATEIGPCPWQKENWLVQISLKAKDLDESQLPPSNLVFLIDVSGSMNHENKLPLLKKSLLMLADELGEKDRIAIVVYAGSDKVVLQPTAGSQKKTIKDAVNALNSGGSTHASSGIQTAYNLALQSFMPGGNNRIILSSDGDFNVGITSRGELERLIAEKKESGIYLTVLGFGMGNFHDDTMEILADRGNGNYAYIDSLLEAKKVLIKERSSTLFTLADDVKMQVEFNPARVGAYRLLGYENRALADEDFNNDKKDAGEIGVGHTVTALYEIIPAGSQKIPAVDPLKYQKNIIDPKQSDELLTVKLRYKPLNKKQSLLLTRSEKTSKTVLGRTSTNFRFAAAVAGFGLLLQHSEYGGNVNYPDLIELARSAKGEDHDGYRAEFIRLLEMSEMLTL